MPVYTPNVTKQIRLHIARAEEMHNFIQASLPQELILDTDKNLIIIALYALAAEHHGAILHLLKAGMFDGSALALTRPMIDAVYRALWLHLCGKPEHFIAVGAGKDPYPGLPNMADAIDKLNPDKNGLFIILKPFIRNLHGYTHGGLEQLGRRFDVNGNIQATYSDGEKLEIINATTAYLVMLAVAWCQIYVGGDPRSEPRSAAIMKRYSEAFE